MIDNPKARHSWKKKNRRPREKHGFGSKKHDKKACARP